MQDLKQRWKVGEFYHFAHKDGYWESDVQVVGYRNKEVAVKFLGPRAKYLRDEDGLVYLNAEYDWGEDLVDFNLENK